MISSLVGNRPAFFFENTSASPLRTSNAPPFPLIISTAMSGNAFSSAAFKLKAWGE